MQLDYDLNLQLVEITRRVQMKETILNFLPLGKIIESESASGKFDLTYHFDLDWA